MKIHILSKDILEAQGICWILKSHLSGIIPTMWDHLGGFEDVLRTSNRALVILDMDGLPWEGEELGRLLKEPNIRWIGISSERVFQTAYLGLRFRAEDILFRPISSDGLIKKVQEIRFRLRNREESGNDKIKKEREKSNFDYPDLFLNKQVFPNPVKIVAFLTPNLQTLTLLYETLEKYPFTNNIRLFILSDLIFFINESPEDVNLKEDYQTFMKHWKGKTVEPLALFIHITEPESSLLENYKIIRQLTKQTFFEGYDIILEGRKLQPWAEMDPFLSPLEQRMLIELLEKRNVQAMREWVENEFLRYELPYPDPEMVRIRLTSVLAQIRRYMKSHQIRISEWETAYQRIFQKVIHGSVIHQIVQELIAFITKLLINGHLYVNEESRSIAEKVKLLIESNYWDAQWNLAECADMLGINKSTLSRKFAQESGQSFRKVLHDVRIREAKKLLQEPDISIEKVSYLVGYNHQSYFNTKFKELVSKTPYSFRNSL